MDDLTPDDLVAELLDSLIKLAASVDHVGRCYPEMFEEVQQLQVLIVELDLSARALFRGVAGATLQRGTKGSTLN